MVQNSKAVATPCDDPRIFSAIVNQASVAVSQTGSRSASFKINLRMPPDLAMHIPVLNPSSSDLTLK